MEFKQFEHIRNALSTADKDITEGKMMSSTAIHYKNKVFAFFSQKKKMVFRLGKGFPVDTLDFEINEFRPFKNKKPLSGWYEMDYTLHAEWEALALKALNLMRLEQQHTKPGLK